MVKLAERPGPTPRLKDRLEEASFALGLGSPSFRRKPRCMFRVSAPTLEPDGLSRRHFAMAQAEQEEARRVVKGIAILRGGLTMRVTKSSHGGKS